MPPLLYSPRQTVIHTHGQSLYPQLFILSNENIRIIPRSLFIPGSQDYLVIFKSFASSLRTRHPHNNLSNTRTGKITARC